MVPPPVFTEYCVQTIELTSGPLCLQCVYSEGSTYHSLTLASNLLISIYSLVKLDKPSHEMAMGMTKEKMKRWWEKLSEAGSIIIQRD